jgi:transcriptional regulator with XRE-family HTH domain
MQHITKTFGANVKSLRQLHNISQEALALRCGIYRTYLSRIESGLAKPSLLVLAALAHALEVAPSDLLLADCTAAMALTEAG